MLRMDPFYADVMFGSISIFFSFVRFKWTNYFCSYSFITKWFVFVCPFQVPGWNTTRNNKSHIHAHWNCNEQCVRCSCTLYMNKYIHCMLHRVFERKNFTRMELKRAQAKEMVTLCVFVSILFSRKMMLRGQCMCYGFACISASPVCFFAWVLLFSLDDIFPVLFPNFSFLSWFSLQTKDIVMNKKK